MARDKDRKKNKKRSHAEVEALQRDTTGNKGPTSLNTEGRQKARCGMRYRPSQYYNEENAATARPPPFPEPLGGGRERNAEETTRKFDNIYRKLLQPASQTCGGG